MAKHNKVGIDGENVAVDFLLGKGFKIVERNFRRPYGEIDIVSRETSGKYRFIEVKTVSWETEHAGVPHETPSQQLGATKRVLSHLKSIFVYPVGLTAEKSKSKTSQKTQRQVVVRGETYRPEENMHPLKVRRLLHVIQAYISMHSVEDWQFDLIVVSLDQKKKVAKVRHLEDIVLGS